MPPELLIAAVVDTFVPCCPGISLSDWAGGGLGWLTALVSAFTSHLPPWRLTRPLDTSPDTALSR